MKQGTHHAPIQVNTGFEPDHYGIGLRTTRKIKVKPCQAKAYRTLENMDCWEVHELLETAKLICL